MQSVGSYLRELRVARGVSLEEVARTTRVGQPYLQALESDNFERLPAPVFTKGFIRAYCQALGEPADEALSRYGGILTRASAEPTPPSSSSSGARGRGPVLVSLVLVVALGLGLFFLNLGLQGRSRGPAEAPSPTAVKEKEKELTVSPPPDLPAPREAEPGRARLVARVAEPTWVRVQTDDGRVVQELLPAGATREWVSGKRFVLTVSNAGGISLELNGQPLPALGAKGVVIQNLVIPPEREIPRP